MSAPSPKAAAPSAFSAAVVMARRIAAVTASRITGRGAPARSDFIDPAALESTLRAAVDAAPPGTVRDFRVVELPANRPPFTSAGLELDAGDHVTWFATGRVYLSKLLDIFVEPHFQVWAKVGAGEVFSGTRATHTFQSSDVGSLAFASYFPGEWRDRAGALAGDPNEYRQATGATHVAVIRWGVDAAEGLARLAAHGDPQGLLAAEMERLGGQVEPPDGWRYLWFLGPSEIYSDVAADDEDERARGGIRCHTHCDVGILQYEVDAPFEPDTRLAWEWKVDELPSTIAEHTLPTHDYLSIAVEFSNGIDITYYWSAELAAGTAYWCPLPNWKDREFHVVIRSGNDGLGRWFEEERRLHEDYRTLIGAPPDRIRKVWLIANSTFQRGVGRCDYNAIRILNGNHILEVASA